MVLTIFCLIFGLLVGSFLNVVIYRYPIMLFREWEQMAKEILSDRGFTIKAPDTPLDKQPKNFNMVVPRSACPKCDHKISGLENIPIISYLFLRGKCKGCQTPISLRYPFIELLTGICFAIMAQNFLFGWPLAIALIVTAYFIALSFIDIDHQILPDTMTLPLVWLGLFVAYFNLYIPLEASLIGAIVGYLSLWSVYWLFKIITGKEGMGYGDFKLLAVIGAFMGWEKVLLTIVLSAGVGAILGGLLLLIQGKGKETKIPFGPYLAVAGWISWVWGDWLINQYLVFSGLH
ncbi:MAG: prepilin peptidase [Gammaproteobacteria bacterium]|nr:MAG: prepilin peptidase [Gammaproteobacteria bacterium]